MTKKQFAQGLIALVTVLYVLVMVLCADQLSQAQPVFLLLSATVVCVVITGIIIIRGSAEHNRTIFLRNRYEKIAESRFKMYKDEVEEMRGTALEYLANSRMYKEMLDGSSKVNDDLIAEVIEANGRVNDIREELNQLITDHNALLHHSDQQTKDYAKLSEEVVELESKLKQTQELLEIEESLYSVCTSKYKAVKQEVEMLNDELFKAGVDYDKLQGELENLQSREV